MSLSLSLLLPKTFYQPGEAVLATVQAIFTAADDGQSSQSGSIARSSFSQPTSPAARPCAFINHLTFCASGLERTDPSFIQNLHHPEHLVDAATVRLKKVSRPMFSTADAPLMTDTEMTEDVPANFLVRFRLPASLPPTFKGSAIRFSYSLELKAEYRLKAGVSSQSAATFLTATASTTLLIWPSAESPLLRLPGRAPETRLQNASTVVTSQSVPASVAAFSAAAASRGSSLTGALLPPPHTTSTTPPPHTLSPLGTAFTQPNVTKEPLLAGQDALHAEIVDSQSIPNGALQQSMPREGPFGSAFAQALTGAHNSSGASSTAPTTAASGMPLQPLHITPPCHPSLDASSGTTNGPSTGHGMSSKRPSLPNGGGPGTLPLRTGSSQSAMSLSGTLSSMFLTPGVAVPFTQGSLLAPDLDLPLVIDYPLYSSQCKVRWQAVTEEQLASQFAPSATPHTRYQGQRRGQHHQHNHHFSQHIQDDDENSCSLLGSNSESDSDEGEDSQRFNSYRNASTYSESDHRFEPNTMSPQMYENGGNLFAIPANKEVGERRRATSDQHQHGLGGAQSLQPSRPESVTSDLGTRGEAGNQGSRSSLAGLDAISGAGDGLSVQGSSRSSTNSSTGTGTGPGANGISGAAQTAVSVASSIFRSVLSAPPTPKRAPSAALGGAVAAVSISGGGGGGMVWGALSSAGGRKAAVFGKPYMLSSGSHPLVRIVLQGPMEGPLQPGASFTGLLDFRTGFMTPPAVRCHQVLVMLETEEIIAPECRQSVGRARVGGASLVPYPSTSAAVIIRKLHCEAQEMTSDLAVTHFAFTVPPSGTPSFCTPMVALRWVVRFELTVGQAINFASRPGPRPRLETISWAVPLLVLPPS